MFEMSDYELDRFALAALHVRLNGDRLHQPDLANLADALELMDQHRQKTKGKPMSDDHLKQEAVRLAKQIENLREKKRTASTDNCPPEKTPGGEE
jgi:hypothetical protein